jgi:glutathione S-transferase
VKAKLYSLLLSHPARAARLMLELKGVDHEAVDLVPGMHPVQLRAAGFRRGTVPALKLDSERVQGSVPISHCLEDLVPQPALFPAEQEQRDAVEEAEAWGERELQPIPRRIFRWGTARSRDLRRWLSELSGIPAPGVAAALNAPIARRFARISGASDEGVRANLEALPAMLDRVDGWIVEGTLGGALLNAADCQIASTVRVLLAYDDLRPMLRDRPSAELARRHFPDYPEPIPLRLPEAWLPAG